jgi:hypothetical protein
MRVLGLDLSTVSTGWAILETGDSSPVLKDCGLLNFSSTTNTKQALLLFSSTLSSVINKYKPFDIIVIEDTFVAKNVKTTKILNRVAGVAILTSFIHSPQSQILMIPVMSLRAAKYPKLRIPEQIASKIGVALDKKLDKKIVQRAIMCEFNLNEAKDDVTDAIVAASFPFCGLVKPKWIM